MADFTPFAAYLLLAGGLFGFILSQWGTLRAYFSQPRYRNLLHPVQAVIVLCVGYLGFAVLEVTVRVMIRGGIAPEDLGGVPQDLLYSQPLATIAIIGVVMPVLEEILARGYFLEPFIRLRKPIVGVIISSVLFGFAHLPHAFAATAFGFGMCYLRFVTGSLAVPIAAHISINSFLLILGYVAPITQSGPAAAAQYHTALTIVISSIMIGLSIPIAIQGVRIFRKVSRSKIANQS
jgi:membrane protease YdiL (CAAX protease family)